MTKLKSELNDIICDLHELEIQISGANGMIKKESPHWDFMDHLRDCLRYTESKIKNIVECLTDD